MKKIISLLWIIISITFGVKSQYISHIYEYMPAPGQHTNSRPWGHAVSPASLIGKIDGTLSLGAFGGYVVFGFDCAVHNHPDNPFGVDFTIFGNPLTDWSEPGVVYVMQDVNQNGLPDDQWYQLAGSDYYFSDTNKSYQVNYQKVADGSAGVIWQDNGDSSGVLQTAFYPDYQIFENIDAANYTLTGTCLANQIDTSVAATLKFKKRAFGYADNQARGNPPFTIPDNPYTAELENSGGDAFDISWAIDETGNYVDLDSIHFIKVQSAVLADAGWLGEVSTEITGAAIVNADKSVDGTSDLLVIKDLPEIIKTKEIRLEAFIFGQGRLHTDQEIDWNTNRLDAYVDENRVLHVENSGELILTATAVHNPEITANLTLWVNLSGQTAVFNRENTNKYSIFPNPAADFFKITGLTGIADIFLYDVSGKTVLKYTNVTAEQAILINHLPVGIYTIKIKHQNKLETQKFIKH